ncbi:MAG: hypothetical protein ACFE8J_14745 [Candidatus Heimdallarchaeota archaeon]
MLSLLPGLNPVLDDVFSNVNGFLEIFFGYLKYIFFAILLAIGLLTLFSLRGKYFLERLRYSKEEKLADNPLTKPRIIISSVYLVIAFGVLFNWFTYLLIIVLDPLPDRFIFLFIQLSGITDPFGLNIVADISQATRPFEATIYYAVAMVSFIALLDILISIWQMVVRDNINEKKALIALIGGIVLAMLTGFTTCLPLFL